MSLRYLTLTAGKEVHPSLASSPLNQQAVGEVQGARQHPASVPPAPARLSTESEAGCVFVFVLPPGRSPRPAECISDETENRNRGYTCWLALTQSGHEGTRLISSIWVWPGRKELGATTTRVVTQCFCRLCQVAAERGGA